MYLARQFPLLLLGLLVAGLVLAACAGQQTSEMTDAAPSASMEQPAMDDADAAHDAMESEESAEDAPAEPTMVTEEQATEVDAGASDSAESGSGEMAEEPMVEQVERPAWQQIALTDARTGEQFTLADYAGKTVFVEPFATWCGNCRRQLGNVQSAYAALGDDAVFVALSVEPNIANEALVDYADKAGFEYTFAAMPPEMLQELAALYGQTVANPPATPHFIIRPDGSTTDLVTGIEESGALVEQIQAAAG